MSYDLSTILSNIEDLLGDTITELTDRIEELEAENSDLRGLLSDIAEQAGRF